MRVSLNRRLDRIRDHLLPPNSMAWRIDRLPDHLKREHLMWRKRCDALNSQNKKQGGNRYEQLLKGNDNRPPMPIAVYRALWPDGEGRSHFTRDTTVDEAAQLYEQMLEEGKSE